MRKTNYTIESIFGLNQTSIQLANEIRWKNIFASETPSREKNLGERVIGQIENLLISVASDNNSIIIQSI